FLVREEEAPLSGLGLPDRREHFGQRLIHLVCLRNQIRGIHKLRRPTVCDDSNAADNQQNQPKAGQYPGPDSHAHLVTELLVRKTSARMASTPSTISVPELIP